MNDSWRCNHCGTYNKDGSICTTCRAYRYEKDPEKLRIMTEIANQVNNNANDKANKSKTK